jgi:zinc transport system permease protein
MAMDDFFLRALLAGAGIAAVAGPLGSFVVWRRMAYFGDTLSHSALLGITIGFIAGIDPMLGVAAGCLGIAVLLLLLRHGGRLADDTLLGILSHGSLAMGIVALAFVESMRVDLMSYLFGDVLAVTVSDLAWIYAGGVSVLVVLIALWRPLLFATIHEDLARVSGVRVAPAQVAFMLLLALVVALAMKVVGILLVTSLLIIPAASGRLLSRSPEQMALWAAGLGVLAVVVGLQASLLWDLPAGPAIVVAATVAFALLTMLSRAVAALR